MTLLPEQLSAARTSPFEAQLDFFRAVATQAFESAEQVISLNLTTSRVSVERSSDAVRQLFAATDPRDLLLLGSQTQQQFQSLLAYSRELLSIASDARTKIASIGTRAQDDQPASAAPRDPAAAAEPAREAAAAPAPVPASPAPAVAAAQPPQPAPAADDAIAAQVASASKQPVVAAVREPEPQPVAKAKPLAKALSKATGKAASTMHPAASPVADAAQHGIELPPVKPVEAAPPPLASRAAAVDAKRGGAPGAKGGRRK